MSNKIVEMLVEPTKIHVGSSFKLKIKCIRYMTYNEVKTKTYNQIKSYTYNQLKGE